MLYRFFEHCYRLFLTSWICFFKSVSKPEKIRWRYGENIQMNGHISSLINWKKFPAGKIVRRMKDTVLPLHKAFNSLP